MSGKCSSTSKGKFLANIDSKTAFENAMSVKIKENVFMSDKLKRFFEVPVIIISYSLNLISINNFS